MIDAIDPLAAGVDWTIAHWFAIMIAAGMASLAVRAVGVIEWWRSGGPWT